MTPAQFQTLLGELEAGADIALPLLGEGELVPIVTAAASLVSKIATAATARSGDATVAAAMQAARVAADVAEQIKYGPQK